MGNASKRTALRRGSVEWLDNDDPARVLSYLRRAEGQELAVASKRGLLVWTLKPLEGKVREALGRLEEQVGAKLDRQDQLVEMVRVNRWTSYLP